MKEKKNDIENNRKDPFIYEGQFVADKDDVIKILKKYFEHLNDDQKHTLNIEEDSNVDGSHFIFGKVDPSKFIHIPFLSDPNEVIVAKFEEISLGNTKIEEIQSDGYWEIEIKAQDENTPVKVKISSFGRLCNEILKAIPKMIEDQLKVLGEDLSEQEKSLPRIVNFNKKSPGRPPNSEYDDAYQKLIDGKAYDRVFECYCKDLKYDPKDRLIRENFDKAMDRRKKKDLK